MNYIYKIIKNRVEERKAGRHFPACVSYIWLLDEAGVPEKELTGHLNQLYKDGLIGMHRAINDKMIYIKNDIKKEEFNKIK